MNPKPISDAETKAKLREQILESGLSAEEKEMLDADLKEEDIDFPSYLEDHVEK